MTAEEFLDLVESGLPQNEPTEPGQIQSWDQHDVRDAQMVAALRAALDLLDHNGLQVSVLAVRLAITDALQDTP